MRRNRLEEAEYRRIAAELDLPVTEVRRAVQSFFGVILGQARSLPLNDMRKIYTKGKFSEFVKVWNIPSVGRMGPVYSRYLCWRGNESKLLEQEPRKNYRSRIDKTDIETMAADILEGKSPSL